MSEQKEKLIHDEMKGTSEEQPFRKAKEKDSSKALQTYFRSSFRVHMGLLTLADRKANIMLRLNSLLITGMVLFFKNIVAYNEYAIVTIVIFLITLLASLIFATLATKPKSNPIEKPTHPETPKSRLFLFIHFLNYDQASFEESFEDMMNNTGKIYNNMTSGIYSLGQILERKYRLLQYSYNIFIVGLVLTILSLLIIIFL